MGIFSNPPNDNLTALQVVSWKSEVLAKLNDLDFLSQRMKVQLKNMKQNPEFTQEDIDEMDEIVKYTDSEINKRAI